MPATMLQAVRAVYDSLVPDVPQITEGAWAGVLIEGSARSFPNVCVTHQGEVPEYSKAGVAYETGSFRFDVFAIGLTACETLAQIIKDAYVLTALAIDGRSSLLFRRRYVVMDSKRRGSEGEIVFQATIDYEAKINKPGS